MSKKRILVVAIVVAILAALVYLQFNTWRKFDWGTFLVQTHRISSHWYDVVIAILLIYAADTLRAWRWKIFLRPVCKARFRDLVAPQFIGFTGLALLGRPGELVRPYIIAKKEGLSVSSQMAVWAVERIFDIGAFAVLMVLDVFVFTDLLPFRERLHEAGYILVAIVLAMAVGAWMIRRFGLAISAWAEGHLKQRAPHLVESVGSKIRAFSEGLNTIHDLGSFVALSGISLIIWFIIAMAYRFVMHAYVGTPLQAMEFPQVVFVMGSSMVGSLFQLPAVGGGTQMATIQMMYNGFGIPIELATSAGILLWLVTFVSVVPAGLAIAHREHVSLRELSKEAEREETTA